MLPRVLVVCHNPTRSGQGNIKWEGHEIVQYVDVTGDGGLKRCDREKYTCGWDSLGAKPELIGTMDKVFAPFCPIALQLSAKTESPPPQKLDFKTGIDKDVFVTAFSYLKPGGVLLIPWEPEAIRGDSLETLHSTFGEDNVKVAKLDGPTPKRSPPNKSNPTEFETTYLQITKPMTAGRRKKTARRRRRYSRSSVRRTSRS